MLPPLVVTGVFPTPGCLVVKPGNIGLVTLGLQTPGSHRCGIWHIGWRRWDRMGNSIKKLKGTLPNPKEGSVQWVLLEISWRNAPKPFQ